MRLAWIVFNASDTYSHAFCGVQFQSSKASLHVFCNFFFNHLKLTPMRFARSFIKHLKLTPMRFAGSVSIMPRSKFWQSGGTKWGMWNTPFFTFSRRVRRLSSSNGRAPWKEQGKIIQKLVYSWIIYITKRINWGSKIYTRIIWIRWFHRIRLTKNRDDSQSIYWLISLPKTTRLLTPL